MGITSLLKVGKKVAKSSKKVKKRKSTKGGPVKAGRTERQVFGTHSSTKKPAKKKAATKKTPSKKTKKTLGTGTSAGLIVGGEGNRLRKRKRN